jgi:hypothetical protein
MGGFIASLTVCSIDGLVLVGSLIVGGIDWFVD